MSVGIQEGCSEVSLDSTRANVDLNKDRSVRSRKK